MERSQWRAALVVNGAVVAAAAAEHIGTATARSPQVHLRPFDLHTRVSIVRGRSGGGRMDGGCYMCVCAHIYFTGAKECAQMFVCVCVSAGMLLGTLANAARVECIETPTAHGRTECTHARRRQRRRWAAATATTTTTTQRLIGLVSSVFAVLCCGIYYIIY